MLVLIFLLASIIAPGSAEIVNSNHMDSSKPKKQESWSPLDHDGGDLLADISLGLETCGTDCFRKQGRCECPRNREKRSLHESNKFSDLGKNFPIPTGFFHPNSSFTPLETASVIAFDITERKQLKESVVITGQSSAEILMEVGSSITWKLSDDDSFEHKKLTVSIYDYEQVYSLTHSKWVIDRKVRVGSETTCTKDCSENCGCKMESCINKKYDHDRGWGCNPGWCWASGIGCTCCYAFVDISSTDYLWAHMETKFVENRIIVCLIEEQDKFNCKLIKGFESFSVDKYEIQIGNIYNQQTKLPRSVILNYRLSKMGRDMSIPDSILLNPEVCDHTGCVHGQIGDTIISSEDPFSGHDGRKLKDPSVIWKGVTLSRECQFAKNPTCYADGLVENISELFSKETEIRENLNDDFVLYNLKKGSISVRPKSNPGQINILIKARGVELERISNKIAVQSFRIIKCNGCRGCSRGFTCTIVITLKSPDHAIIHIDSTTDGVLVNNMGIQSSMSPKTTNVTLYTSANINKLSLIITETKTEATFEGIKLSEPKLEVIRNGQTVSYSSVLSEDLSTFSGITQGVIRFGKGLFSLVSGLFFDWKKLISAAVVITMLIILYKLNVFRHLLGRKRKINAGKEAKIRSEKNRIQVNKQKASSQKTAEDVIDHEIYKLE